MGKKRKLDFPERIKSLRTHLIEVTFRRLPPPLDRGGEIKGRTVVRVREFGPDVIKAELEVSVYLDPGGIFEFVAKWNISAVPREPELSRDEFTKHVNLFIGPSVFKSILHLGALSSDLSPGMPPFVISPAVVMGNKAVEIVWDEGNDGE